MLTEYEFWERNAPKYTADVTIGVAYVAARQASHDEYTANGYSRHFGALATDVYTTTKELERSASVVPGATVRDLALLANFASNRSEAYICGDVRVTESDALPLFQQVGARMFADRRGAMYRLTAEGEAAWERLMVMVEAA